MSNSHEDSISQQQDELPFVSVVLPVRNEAEFIVENLEKLLKQDYPSDAFEILVADGESDDGTRELVEQFGKKDSRVKVFGNPKRIVPTGMNILIKEAKGKIIIRLDGHAYVANDFIKQSVETLLQGGEDVWAVGGPIVHVAKTPLGKAISEAMSHPLGVGNATHRQHDYEGFGEGTAFPAMYRWVFDRAGLYDESLARNEDDELYFRIKKAGGKFYITPKIGYVYFVREKLGQLFNQYYQYSIWRIPVMEKHKQPTTFRQIIPSLFYIAMLAAMVVGVFLSSPLIALGLPIVYLGALTLVGVSKIASLGFGIAMRIPIAILVMHAGYAWGMIHGWLCRLVGSDPWSSPDANVAKLTR